jgi:hypothetical protein
LEPETRVCAPEYGRSIGAGLRLLKRLIQEGAIAGVEGACRAA